MPEDIANEVVFRVSKTPQGYKLQQRDGRGLADNVFVSSYERYFYPSDYDDPEERAHEAAYEKAEELDAETRVVELGDRR